jgi:uncharacterized membrane protein
MQMISEQWSGPLPHPGDLEQYEAIVPGAAAMILASFGEQGNHRRKQENRLILGNEIRSFIGQIMAFVIALAFLFASYRLINSGHQVSGSVVGTVDLVALVTVFIVGRRAAAGDE